MPQTRLRCSSASRWNGQLARAISPRAPSARFVAVAGEHLDHGVAAVLGLASAPRAAAASFADRPVRRRAPRRCRQSRDGRAGPLGLGDGGGEQRARRGRSGDPGPMPPPLRRRGGRASTGRPAPGPVRPLVRSKVTSRTPASASLSRWNAATDRATSRASAASSRRHPAVPVGQQPVQVPPQRLVQRGDAADALLELVSGRVHVPSLKQNVVDETVRRL